jgi:phosphopantothenoylcysteine synthetase/decarboxylase
MIKIDKSLPNFYKNISLIYKILRHIIGSDENEGFLINKSGEIKNFKRENKESLAEKLIDEIS